MTENNDVKSWAQSDRVSVRGPSWSGLAHGRLPVVVSNTSDGVVIQLHPDEPQVLYPHSIAEVRFSWVRNETDDDVLAWNGVVR